MVIPLGLAEAPSQRSPWMSALIALACIVVFAVDDSHLRASTPRAEQLELLREYWNQHPYLIPPEDIALELPEEAARAREENHKRLWAGTLPNEETIAAETTTWLEPITVGVSDSWHYTWGLVPSHGLRQDGLFTHLFMHASWSHLLGNLLFLWLVAPALEGLLGPFLFLLFYVCGGVVAAMAQYAAAPGSAVPIIGASGAIAACMGAFTIRFARARFRLLLLGFGLWPRRTWEIPAWLWGALWMGEQLVVVLFGGAAGEGIAVLAHIGGFFAGVGAGVGFRLLYPPPRAAGAGGAAPKNELAWADAAAERGETELAIHAYRSVLRESPRSLPALWGLTRALFAEEEDEEASEVFDSVLELWMADNSEALIQQSLRLYGSQLDTRLLDPVRAARVAPTLEVIDSKRALWAYEAAAGGGIPEAVLRLAELMSERGNRPAALELLEQFRTLRVAKPELVVRSELLQRTLVPSSVRGS